MILTESIVKIIDNKFVNTSIEFVDDLGDEYKSTVDRHKLLGFDLCEVSPFIPIDESAILYHSDNRKVIVVSKEKIGLRPECSGLFKDTHFSTIDVYGLDFSNVTSMSFMFSSFSGEEIILGGIDTSKVRSFENTFHCCLRLKYVDIETIDTSSATSMRSMFSYCYELDAIDLSNLNTEKVTNMSCMFEMCLSLTKIDLSNFKTPKLTSVNSIFNGCKLIQEIDISTLDFRNVTSMQLMFSGMEKLNKVRLRDLCTRKINGIASMFEGCLELEQIDFSDFNFESLKHMDRAFTGCKSLKSINFGEREIDATNLRSLAYAFYGCTSLESIDLSNFKFSKLDNLREAFRACISLKSIKIPISNMQVMKFGHIKVNCMLSGCTNLETVDFCINKENKIHNVTDTYGMFFDCAKLKGVLDLRNIDLLDLGKLYQDHDIALYLKPENSRLKVVLDMQNDIRLAHIAVRLLSKCSNIEELKLINTKRINKEELYKIEGKLPGINNIVLVD